MTPADLLKTARARGIDLRVVGAEVRYRAKQSQLTHDLLAVLRAHRDGIRKLLEAPPVAEEAACTEPAHAGAEPKANTAAPAPRTRDALFGCGLVLDLMREYRTLFGAPEGFITLLEQVSGCDALRECVTDDHLLQLRAHLDGIRLDRGAGS